MGRGSTLRGVFVLMVAMMMIAAGSAYLAVVDFENPSLGEGDSVEGMGTVHPYLDITPWSLGNAIVIVDSGGIKAYQGGSGAAPGDEINNLCLEDPDILGADQGIGTTFAVPQASDATWRFDFDPGVWVGDFSIDMLDYGDWFPYGDDYGDHTATLTAYDAGGSVLDAYSFTSGDKNAAKYDACGTDGIQRLGVAAPPGQHIAYAEITFDVVDTGIAFDNIEFNYECVPAAQEYTLIAGQNIDAGTVTVFFDGEFVSVEFQTDGMWLMTETHVAVEAAWEDIPQTKKNNPRPGQFEFSETHDPWTDHYTYMIPWDGTYPVYIAAHAALVEADFGGPFWASEVVGTGDGGFDMVGAEITGERALAGNALGEPDSVRPDVHFYVPGFSGSWTYDDTGAPLEFTLDTPPGGWIEVAFDGLIFNGDGDYDVSIHETTWGTQYPYEEVKVEALFDGTWHAAGYAGNQDETNAGAPGNIDDKNWVTYLDLPDGIPYAESLRITDMTEPIQYGTTPVNGFDLDAVDAAVLYYGEETGWGEGPDFPGKNWAMYMVYEPDTDWCEVPNLVLRETVLVPSNGETVSSSILSNGSDYLLKASGTYTFANTWTVGGVADAQCSLRPNGEWVLGSDLSTPYTDMLEVQVGSLPFAWNPTTCDTAGHVYTGSLVGGGSSIDFRIVDSYYGDNVDGDLQVSIYEWVSG